MTKKRAKEIIEILKGVYPDAKCELVHETPFELLIATILSAQCTDVRVNQLTSVIFKKYNKPEDFLNMGIENLEELIKPCGFFRNKAKSIMGASEKILREYNGRVPETIEELMTLPGVGKKTANVVASNCFNIPAIAVDTHVFRVSNRIGLAKATNVEKTEEQLMKIIDKNEWTLAHHLIIFHGRRRCKARSPECDICELREYCNYYEKNMG